MIIKWKKETAVLLLGDLFLFTLALWLTLFLRLMKFPDEELFRLHIYPFSWVFVAWVIIFFITGLYDRQTNNLKRKLPSIIFNSQIVNSIVAAIFFYFDLLPNVAGITPKTNLIIYLVISTVLIYLWRVYFVDLAYFGRAETALLVGEGSEVEDLSKEMSKNKNYRMNIKRVLELDENVIRDIKNKKILSVIMDPRNVLVGKINMTEAIFLDVKFIDIKDIYEDIFKKVPLSFIDDRWFLENVSNHPKVIYEIFKRVMDIVVSIFLMVPFLLILPFVAIVIWLEDRGPIFIKQERIGQGNKIINVFKLRSMTANDIGYWPSENDKRITRVGRLLRKTRLDEFPQLWNVFKGDMSLIGPRPDIIGLGQQLKDELKYYKIRNIIKPGLSGWAQINQDLPPHSLEETKERLAYDFFYIKNRSIALDIEIALKTIKTLLSIVGK